MKNNFVEFIFATLNESNPTEFNKYPGHCGIYLGVNSFIHASRLIRTKETLAIAYDGDAPIIYDNRIIERDFGEFEGLTRSEFDFNGFWNGGVGLILMSYFEGIPENGNYLNFELGTGKLKEFSFEKKLKR